MNKVKNITLTDELQARLKDLKEELGYPSETMVIYAGINELHRKMFPPHTVQQRKDPTQRVKEKLEQKEAREAILLKERMTICEQLGGTVEQKEGGAKVCVYFTYAGRKRYGQETPLHLITQDILTTQYSPDRYTVEALQHDGKVEYPVDKTKPVVNKKPKK